MYDPFTGKYVITNDWPEHIARGSLGGIDWAMPVGTPLPAPSDGNLTFIPFNGTGGHTAVITRPDGSRTQYMHMSQFGITGPIRQGQTVGLSGGAYGAPGAGSSTGPHVHAHDITPNGVRVPPFTTGLQFAGLPTTPFEKEEDDDMARLDPIFVKTLKGNVAGGAIDQFALIYSTGLVIKPVTIAAANEWNTILGYGATWVNSSELVAFEAAAAAVRG